MSKTYCWHKWGQGSTIPSGEPVRPDYKAKLGLIGGDNAMNDEEWLLDEEDLFVSLEELDLDKDCGYDDDLLEEYNWLGVYDD